MIGWIVILAALGFLFAFFAYLLNQRRQRVTLCVGYTRTGKDTLYSDFRSNDAFVTSLDTSDDEYKEVRWYVYSLKGEEPELSGNMVRVGFADALKEDACKSLGLRGSWIDYEAEKNTKMVIDPFSLDTITLRQYYIVFGQRAKEEHGESIWARRAFATWAGTNHHLFACDTRFFVELFAAMKIDDKPQTIRLFRSEVPIPVPVKDGGYDSEHSLDILTTKFLFVADKDRDFKKAVELWPQYKNYVCKWKIVI